MPQIHFPKTKNRYVTVTYQSNNYLNEEVDNKVKKVIAKSLFDAVKILMFHSYVHGQIIVEVSDSSPIEDLKKIIAALEKPMASQTPALLYTADLTSFSNNNTPELPTQWISVHGDSDMNTKFLKSIEDFYPEKLK